MEHNLYILKASNLNGEQLIKFGYSSKLKERLEQYFSHNPFTEILYTFYKENAIDFEKKFHKYNISKFKNEWYSYDILEDLIFQINNNIIFNEYTLNKNNKRNYKKPELYIIPDKQTCYKCHINKDINEFHKNCWKKSGHSRLCKECTIIDNEKYRLNKRDSK